MSGSARAVPPRRPGHGPSNLSENAPVPRRWGATLEPRARARRRCRFNFKLPLQNAMAPLFVLVLGLAQAFVMPSAPLRPRLALRSTPEEEGATPLTHDYARSAEFGGDFVEDDLAEIDEIIALRSLAKTDRDYRVADELRDELASLFEVFVDDGARSWRVGEAEAEAAVRDAAFDASVPRTGGFLIPDAVFDLSSDAAARVPRGRGALERQEVAYRALVNNNAAQVWVNGGGRDFLAGRVRAADGATVEDAFALQRDLIEWSAQALHLPIGGKRPKSLAWSLAPDAPDEKIAAWEETPGLEAQPSAITAPPTAVAVGPNPRAGRVGVSAADVGFLPAKSPLHPQGLGNQVNDWKTHGMGGVNVVAAVKPTGSAAGNTGRGMQRN